MSHKRRRAVSPVIAEMILVAVAIATGLGVWAFTESSVGARVQAQAQQTAQDINAVRERFVIVSLNVTSPNTVSIFVYNNGLVSTDIVSVLVGNTTSWTPVDFGGPVTVAPGEIRKVTFSFSFSAGQTLFVKAVGNYGTINTYVQEV